MATMREIYNGDVCTGCDTSEDGCEDRCLVEPSLFRVPTPTPSGDLPGSVVLDGFDTPIMARTFQGRPFVHAPKRQQRPRWIVLHWTASERVGTPGDDLLHKSLSRRGLSVDFFVDNDGVIFQHNDPGESYTRHAGRINSQAIGIEVSNYGWVPRARPVPKLGRDRETYRAAVHGRPVKMANYYPLQQRAVNVLVSALCDAFEIPRRVELAPFTQRRRAYLDDPQQGGVMGHLHCHRSKVDPGPRVLQAVDEYLNGGE